MESLSLFSKRIHIVLAGVLSYQCFALPLSAETSRPFPVMGTVRVDQGRWDAAPELLAKLAEKVDEEPIRLEILSAEAEQFFSTNLLEESRRAFQRLLKARRPSPSLYAQQMASLRLAEISLLTGYVDDALSQVRSL